MSSQPHFKHQEFSIDNAQRRRVVRQDRHFPKHAKHILRINQKDYSVENYSAFGVAIKENVNNFSSNDYHTALYIVNGLEICEVPLKYAREGQDGLVAFAIEGHALPVEAILAAEQSFEIINTFEITAAKFHRVPETFKHKTYELKAWIEALETEVVKIEKTSFDIPLKELQNFEEATAQTISQYLEHKLPLFLHDIGASIATLSSKEIKLCYEFLRYQVGGTFYKSSYGSRSYFKPRGYAGDYEMMNNVYYNELRGKNLFSKCVQRFFTDSSAGKAVKNRAAYLNNKIEEVCKRVENPKILGVASGPAREIQKLFLEKPELASKCEIHLLDQDDEALKFSQREIFEICRSKNVKPNIHFHNLAIKNVISDGLPMTDFDLIYSAGLFDYFTDPVAQFAANRLHMALKQGGQLVIGNFNTNNPTQFVMEALGDWYLIYRDEQMLMELFSKISPKLRIEKEPENVNLFAVMEK